MTAIHISLPWMVYYHERELTSSKYGNEVLGVARCKLVKGHQL